MTVQREMPKYQCHKQVWALKIAEVRQAPADQPAAHEGGDWLLVPTDSSYSPIVVGHDEFVLKHRPKAGGYYVVYEDGYASYSPAEAFEDGYVLLGNSKVAVGVGGATYHNPEAAYHDAEEAECVSMALDKAGVPRCEASGLSLSLWGRVCQLAIAPEGWLLAPTEPTKDMCEAGAIVPVKNCQSEAAWIGDIYRAMLAVAPRSRGAIGDREE